jgi:hypothetical protein
MRELPGAGAAEHDELDENPPDDASVCCLRLVTELGLPFLLHGSRLATVTLEIAFSLIPVQTYSLEHLLPPHVVQPRIQVLEPPSKILNLGLVGALELARLADGKVEGQADAAVGLGGAEPGGAARRRRGLEADLVVACVGGREGEAARLATALRDDAVVVVEDFLLDGCLAEEPLATGPLMRDRLTSTVIKTPIPSCGAHLFWLGSHSSVE